MKKLYIVIAITSLLSAWISSAHATVNANLWDSFIFLANTYDKETPESFKYIDIKFSGVNENSELQRALQKLVYHNLIKNIERRISPNSQISVEWFGQLSKKILWADLSINNSEETRKRALTYSDLEQLSKKIEEQKKPKWIKISSWFSVWKDLGEKGEIFYDVYNTLQRDFYGKEDVSKKELIEGAIIGLTQSTGDKYTTYFPPTQSEEFYESLESQNEYEWIGAYVEMQTPGEFIIISPIVGSPSAKSWLKWWDRVLEVDGKEITPETPSRQVVSWIKWPAGSIVELRIQREGKSQPITIKVTRGNIIIKDVEYEKKWRDTAYIQIKSFGDEIDTQLKEILEQVVADNSIKKIIIDVRNNPGGFLWKVSNVLSYIVPKWEPTAIVSTWNKDIPYTSQWYDLIDFQNYEVVFLQNSWSASAAEILVGSARDYLPNMKVIWEQSFWKGSVQTLRKYIDGSTLKYTTARWYTGKTRTWIDGIGITPDILLEYDETMFKNLKRDNQLDRALSE